MATLTTALVILVVIVLPFYTIYKPPRFLVQYFQQKFPQVLFHASTTQKLIALTIDDAPSAYTKDILDILTANDAHATFFVIGNQVVGRENTLVDLITAGNELGNHAMHDEPSISLPSNVLAAEISQVNAQIDTAYAAAEQSRTNHLFRPGSGVFSRRLLDIADQGGYRTILGSIYPHDPFIKYWWINARHILSMLRPGAVVICHDRRSWTVPMLSKVVPEMKRRGYEVVTVSEFLERTKG
ncbi:hypothetical protein MBLNU230_g3884t1 [Neophaeotheca triangularis]